MRLRYICGGVGGLVLTLACGSKVEIGHGDGEAGEPATAQGGSSPTGGTESGSAGAPRGGTASGGSAGATSGGTTHVGGPIPRDDGSQALASKVDLLLVVDNSFGMKPKQQLLAEALPSLVQRLVNPPCVDAEGNVVATPASPSVKCPSASAREIAPVRDLHIGAISSSLGSHGASGPNDICTKATDDDRALLLPSVRSGLPSYDDLGYLKWDPDARATPAGEADIEQLLDGLQALVEGAGEEGCGFEAQLESAYRFLVDPSPPARVERTGEGITAKVGVNQTLLAQRAAFLRADSSVVVVILTDENDCSVVDEGFGWLLARTPSVGSAPNMYRSTSQCATNPNDPCCQSCGETVTNDGCPPIEQDEACQQGETLSSEEDAANLRCWDHKRRFGFDLLYPTARYVSGFGGGTVPDRNGTLVPNPLFSQGGVTRDPSLVTFAVIGGMPWQDVATKASLSGPELELLTAAQLESQGRWPLLIGDEEANEPPLDPFMRESTDERSGKNPLTNESIVGAESTDPSANSINGHELNTLRMDLQYACTFDLPEPVVCDLEVEQAGGSCSCFEEDLVMNSPLCNPPGGGAATTTQHKSKATPALRELRVARELGSRTVLGSVCSRNTRDDSRSDYGYRPIMDSLGRRVAATLEKP